MRVASDECRLRFLLSRTRRQLMTARAADGLAWGWGLGLMGWLACWGAAAWGVAPGGGAIHPLWALLAPVLAVLWACRRRPTLAEAAAFLDARFSTHYLFARAWALRDASNEPWAALLKSQADAHAGTIGPSALPVRYPLRWHGVALLIAMAACVIPVSAGPARGAGTGAAAGAGTGRSRETRPLEVARAQTPPADAAESSGRLPGPSAADHVGGMPHPTRPASDAAGQGAADTPDRPTPANTLPDPQLPPAAARELARDGRLDGSASNHSTSLKTNSYGTLTAPPARAATDDQPLGRTGSAGSGARASAGDEAAVPAGYRSLVRDFFAR
ncbi:MAG: hypothetical protein ACTHM6_03435 [Tepidisphaeraceae bacterium]